MTDFELWLLGLTFFLTLVNSLHILIKYRADVIDKEILDLKKKAVTEYSYALNDMRSKLAQLEASYFKQASSAVYPTSCLTNVSIQPKESVVSPPVV